MEHQRKIGTDKEAIAVMIKKAEYELPNSAPGEGIIAAFRNVLNAQKIKQEMQDDAKRLLLHSKELVEWDVGDDHATAYEVQEIAKRLAKCYGLKIKGAD